MHLQLSTWETEGSVSVGGAEPRGAEVRGCPTASETPDRRRLATFGAWKEGGKVTTSASGTRRFPPLPSAAEDATREGTQIKEKQRATPRVRVSGGGGGSSLTRQPALPLQHINTLNHLHETLTN